MRPPVIVLVGADLSVSFGIVIVVQNYNTSLHFSFLSCAVVIHVLQLNCFIFAD